MTAAQPRKIALDGCCFVGNPTGIGNYVSALLREMCRQHPDVAFYSMSNDACRDLNIDNVTFRMSTPRRRGPVWQNTQLVDMIRADDIDVFWGTNGVIPLRRLARTSTVVTIHDLVHRFAPATQLPMIRWKQRVFQPLCARAADRIVAVSQATANDVELHYGRKADAVIHPLAAPEFKHVAAHDADATLKEFSLPERFILTVGTLEPRKNLASLIEAYWSCRNAGLALPPLVLVGGRGWFNEKLQGLIDRVAESGSLHYLGYVANDKLAHLYARCSMLVMPSLYEGFGMPILEAQACGAPVVYGPHGSMGEAAGGIGICVDGSVPGLRRALEEFARNELPLACRRLLATDNDAQVSADRMWGVIVDSWREQRGLRL